MSTIALRSFSNERARNQINHGVCDMIEVHSCAHLARVQCPRAEHVQVGEGIAPGNYGLVFPQSFGFMPVVRDTSPIASRCSAHTCAALCDQVNEAISSVQESGFTAELYAKYFLVSVCTATSAGVVSVTNFDDVAGVFLTSMCFALAALFVYGTKRLVIAVYAARSSGVGVWGMVSSWFRLHSKAPTAGGTRTGPGGVMRRATAVLHYVEGEILSVPVAAAAAQRRRATEMLRREHAAGVDTMNPLHK